MYWPNHPIHHISPIYGVGLDYLNQGSCGISISQDKIADQNNDLIYSMTPQGLIQDFLAK